MIYFTASPDFVLQLLPTSQVMQFVKCSQAEAEMLVHQGYTSFLAASRSKCRSCRDPACDGNCPVAQKDRKNMRKHHVHSMEVPSGGRWPTRNASPFCWWRHLHKFTEREWLADAHHLLARAAVPAEHDEWSVSEERWDPGLSPRSMETEQRLPTERLVYDIKAADWQQPLYYPLALASPV